MNSIGIELRDEDTQTIRVLNPLVFPTEPIRVAIELNREGYSVISPRIWGPTKWLGFQPVNNLSTTKLSNAPTASPVAVPIPPAPSESIVAPAAAKSVNRSIFTGSEDKVVGLISHQDTLARDPLILEVHQPIS